MSAPSREIVGQPAARLEQVERALRRHLAQPWRGEVGEVQRAVFARIEAFLAARPPGAPTLLDAGCGTGASTLALCEREPDAWVVGVDKSSDRLARAPALPSRALVLRGELSDLWWLASEHGLRFDRCVLLYPNPWPKPGQLPRRFHGHPVFPRLVQTCAALELRTNWHVYAEEFAFALGLLLGRTIAAERLVVAPGSELSPFERKYRASGHALWRVAASELHEPR